MMAPVTTRIQRDRQFALKREAMRLLLSLPADVDEAREILDFARDLLRGWMQHRVRPVDE